MIRRHAIITPRSRTPSTRNGYWFLCVITGNGLAQAQMWAVNASSRRAAERRLDKILDLQRAGTLTVHDLELAACYPGVPMPATLMQIRAVARVGNGRPYLYRGMGKAVRKPPLVQRAGSDVAPSATSQGSLPHPIQPGPTQDGGTPPPTSNAHPEGSTEAGH